MIRVFLFCKIICLAILGCADGGRSFVASTPALMRFYNRLRPKNQEKSLPKTILAGSSNSNKLVNLSDNSDDLHIAVCQNFRDAGFPARVGIVAPITLRHNEILLPVKHGVKTIVSVAGEAVPTDFELYDVIGGTFPRKKQFGPHLRVGKALGDIQAGES